MYLSNTTRPDIAYATNYLDRFLKKPMKDLWKGAKHVLPYLRGTQKFGIYYNRDGHEAFEGYADSDRAQKRQDRKSVTGLLFLFGAGVISSKGKKTEHRGSEFTRGGIHCGIIC